MEKNNYLEMKRLEDKNVKKKKYAMNLVKNTKSLDQKRILFKQIHDS